MKSYQICNRCIMDTTAQEITFDEHGYCNFCTDFLNTLEQNKNNHNNQQILLEQLVTQVKNQGQGKDYDCIVGLSGGADSSYTLYMVKKLGLRPLAVHLDNGWNSELATNNIETLVKKLNVDLYTHVIDWEEFRDLQLSLFKANVVDIELLTDNAIIAINYKMAQKYGIKYILAGTNLATEGMKMPNRWNHFKYDGKNIRNIHKKFGTYRIDTFPIITTIDISRYKIFPRIKWISFLDYLDYNKSLAVQKLETEIGYRQYPYKHYESIFTRFYQGYILPKKFNVDKRKLHLSNLICSGQMTRDAALKKMEESPYPNEQDLKDDINFFLKKFDWSESELEQYLAEEEILHEKYGSEKKLFDFLAKIHRIFAGKK